MSKGLKIIVSIVILAAACWYFLIKDYNYKVTFKIHQTPSVVYDHLIRWTDYKKPTDSVVKTLNKTASKHITQQYNLQDTTLTINWHLKQLNDSTTHVTAKIKDVENRFMRNLEAINPNSAFSKTSKSAVKRFANSLIENKTNYKVGLVETAVIPSKYCVYLSLKSSTPNKAKTMLYNIPLDGHPFIEVTDWNLETDSIAFDFCFPIKKHDSLPPANHLNFKETQKHPALKTIFNGNYKISDRAWHTLKDYADFNSIKVEDKPVEIFLNDPHTGTDALGWEAEVFLPIKQN